MRKVIKIEKAVSKTIQKAIDTNKPLNDCLDGNPYLGLSANFGNNIEADINIYNSSDGPWIDAILIDHGSEAVVMEPQYVLVGEYPFLYNNKEYIVEIKQK